MLIAANTVVNVSVNNNNNNNNNNQERVKFENSKCNLKTKIFYLQFKETVYPFLTL